MCYFTTFFISLLANILMCFSSFLAMVAFCNKDGFLFIFVSLVHLTCVVENKSILLSILLEYDDSNFLYIFYKIVWM